MEYIARMNPPKVIGLVALAEKPGLVEALRIMRRELSRHGLNSCVIETPEVLEQTIGRCSMLVTFGGDGTMLTVSSLAAMHHVPLAGVNLGRLGFMTSIESGELDTLERLKTGEYTVSRRMMLDIEYEGKGNYSAINDVVFSKCRYSKLPEFIVSVEEY